MRVLNLAHIDSQVPNAPCGVERASNTSGRRDTKTLVPNAPCGVESRKQWGHRHPSVQFLMHRVELKVEFSNVISNFCVWFLMHRVELKVQMLHCWNLKSVKGS